MWSERGRSLGFNLLCNNCTISVRWIHVTVTNTHAAQFSKLNRKEYIARGTNNNRYEDEKSYSYRLGYMAMWGEVRLYFFFLLFFLFFTIFLLLYVILVFNNIRWSYWTIVNYLVRNCWEYFFLYYSFVSGSLVVCTRLEGKREKVNEKKNWA